MRSQRHARAILLCLLHGSCGLLLVSSFSPKVIFPLHCHLHHHLQQRNGLRHRFSALFTKAPPKDAPWTTTGTATQNDDDDNDNEDNNDESESDVVRPFVLLLLSQFLLFLGVGAVIPSIPLYGQELGFSSAANGIVISAPAVALLLCANFGGRWADQKGRKPTMMGGMALIAVSDVGTALADSLPILLMARLGLGAGRAISEAGERGMLVDLAQRLPQVRGRALAAQQAVGALGIAIGAPAGGVVVETYGPRAAFLCVSAAALVALVLYSFLPETMIRRQEDDNDDAITARTKEKASNTDPTGQGSFVIWKQLVRENQWRGLALCQGGASFGFAAKIASIPILAAATLPGGAVGAGTLVSAAGLSGLVGAPLGGFSADRFGAKWTATISGAFSAIGLILVPISLSSPAVTNYDGLSLSFGDIVLDGRAMYFSLAVMIWSVGATAQGPSLTSLAQQAAPPGSEATSLAFVKASGDGTYIVAPFLMGLLADAFVNIPGIECALAGATTLSGTVALALLTTEDDAERTR